MKKIISSLIIVSILLSGFAPAKKTYAVGDEGANIVSAIYNGISSGEDVVAGSIKAKELAELVLKEVAKGVALKFLNDMTKSTVEWANNGFDGWGSSGEALYITDPEMFYQNIRNEQVNNIANKIGYDPEKYPFGEGVARALIEGASNTFENEAEFTLNKSIGDDWEEFEDDFGVGGWDGWLDTVGNPANNPIGFLLLTTNEAEKEKQAAEAENLRELTQSGGFLSVRKCVDYSEPVVSDTVAPIAGEWCTEITPAGGSAFDSCHPTESACEAAYDDVYLEGGGSATSCTFVPEDGGGFELDTDDLFGEDLSDEDFEDATDGGYEASFASMDESCERYEIQTPGTVVGTEISTALTSKFRQSELGSTFGNSLSVILGTVFDQLISQGFQKVSDALTPSEDIDSETYYGSTVAAVTDANSGTTGFDQEVNLNEIFITGTYDPQAKLFNKNTTVIELTQAEIENMFEAYNISKDLPNKYLALDQCVPGPDYGWQTRFDDVLRREMGKIEKKSLNATEDNQTEAQNAIYLIDSKKSLIKAQISLLKYYNIPSAATIFSVIEGGVNSATIEAQRFEDIARKTEALALAKSIKAEYESLISTQGLDSITVEKNRLAVKYLNIKDDLSTEDTLNNSAIQVELATEKKDYLDDLLATCESEKLANPVIYDGNGCVDYGNDGTVDEAFDVNFNGTIDCDYDINTTFTGSFVEESDTDSYPLNVIWFEPSNEFGRPADDDGLEAADTMPFGPQMWFYCAQAMDVIFNQHTVDIYNNDDVVIDCKDFYTGNLSNYFPPS